MWSLRRDDDHPWLAPPARAIRYPIAERLADWLSGRRDGAHGIPSVPVDVLDVGGTGDGAGEESAAAFSTHRLEQIRHHHHGRMEGERSAFLRFCDEGYGRQTEAWERVLATEAAAVAARLRHAAAAEEPSEDALGTRRVAEGEHLSDDLVRRRRRAEHERALRRAEEGLAAAAAEAAAARAAYDRIDRTVRGRWVLTLVRVRRLHEHAHRRANVYWRQLVRSHPQGDLLNGALARVGPDLPEWARDDAPMPAPMPALVREPAAREPHVRDHGTDATAPGPDETGDHGDPHVTAP